MTWIKLDDGFPQNPKIVGLSDHSFRNYISALCYSGKYLTDGFILQAIVDKLGDIEELINSGLWERLLDGIQILNFTEYQSTKDEVERKKELNRKRVERHRSVSNGVGNAFVMQPDTDNRIQITDTEKKNGKPYGLAVQELVALYFDNYPKEGLRPSGAMIAGQIQLALKQIEVADLRILVEIVAQDGQVLTQNSLIIAQKRTLEPRNRPTPTPPKFKAEDNPKASPMPDSVKALLGRIGDLP